MPERKEYMPGVPCWVDSTQPDPEAAAEFYGGLFGWELEQVMPPESGAKYFMARIRGGDVGAISSQPSGAPPQAVWNTYVAVASADDAAAKVRDAGGQVMAEPFDVMDAGRMALLQDPAGATLCVWQAGNTIGAGRVNEPGCLTWNELHTPDVDAATSFYGGLFGWTTAAMDTGGGPPYHVIRNGDRSNGGITATQEGEPPNWIPYFAVESLDRAMSAASEGGGATLGGPIPMPAGRIAILRDPQGAVFALWEGQLED